MEHTTRRGPTRGASLEGSRLQGDGHEGGSPYATRPTAGRRMEQGMDVLPGSAPRAVLYVRQSLDAAGDGLAVARQEKVCRELCASRGFAVVGVYADNDASASTTRERKQFKVMLDAAADDQFDVIVAYHLDR